MGDLIYLEAVERLGRAMETRALDDKIINQFNDVYEEAEKMEAYISELEWQNYHSVQKLRRTIEFITSCQKLRRGITQNIKALRRIKGYKPILIKAN